MRPIDIQTTVKALRYLGPLRNKWVRAGILLAIIAGIFGVFGMWSRMPGKSYKGSLPALTADERAMATQLKQDLDHLAGSIGERNVSRRFEKLEESAQWIEQLLDASGWTQVGRQEYQVEERNCRNIEVELRGGDKSSEIVVVGAHYDSVVGSPGANDNGSGVVSLLELARRFAPGNNTGFGRTLRLVFFVNEEPPWFQHEEMGSLVYARRCLERKENIVGMLSLETMGYYSGEKSSQSYPIVVLRPFYPSTGNFISFVGSTKSKDLIREALGLFRQHARFPSEGASIPQSVPGVGWSDHWSFQIHGYPALMVTDTAPFRYPHYHTAEDTPDKVDYESLARVTTGMVGVVRGLLK